MGHGRKGSEIMGNYTVTLNLVFDEIQAEDTRQVQVMLNDYVDYLQKQTENVISPTMNWGETRWEILLDTPDGFVDVTLDFLYDKIFKVMETD
jgi:hypothetical protein